MKKLKSITPENVVNICLVLLTSLGIFLCGYIHGKTSTEALLDTYTEKEIEYIYITEPCREEHITNKIEDVPEEEPQKPVIEPIEAPEWPKLYTDEDAVALAQTLYGEARGVKNNGIVSGTAQKAAVAWCVLNRYDAGYADSIVEVCSAPKQFVGYSPSHPVWDELLELSYDVLDRWNAEKHGEVEVGRVLPAEYLWFGGDGTYNHFRNAYRDGTRWDWSWPDPYED